jgi:aryl-alcohol dehydrogenase-like predicted oxidoreductase
MVRLAFYDHRGPAWVGTPAVFQLEYSLVSRSLEREHLPLAQELGISITPWSPLGSGFLSGKFRCVGGKITGSGRVLDMKDSGNPTLEKFAKRERNWTILDVLTRVAEGLGKAPAEVALAWVMLPRYFDPDWCDRGCMIFGSWLFRSEPVPLVQKNSS